MKVRVLIVDDQSMVRTGFRTFLDTQPDIEVVAEAADGAEAIDRVAECAPDVVLMDVRMPVMDGLEATRRILQPHGDGGEGPTTKVLMLTTFDLDEYVYEALRAGASGFLLKDASAQQLAEAVRVIAAGDAILDPSITRKLIAEFARMSKPRHRTPERVADLTERETEVLVLIAQGCSNAEIAAELVVSLQTVKTHVARLLAKLSLRDRAQAIVYAYESGVVRAGG
ncbi:response regulator transcription factor [Amycolatopsis sp.]|uniref:response regulator transcription factor n=1 Tax=Amycolatopsis sp. TaxID=37632 RepID=UPI002D7FBDD6|nr:response regulator transcription factor [Amycolatopsis sp.]HET6708331.1 response regulator transcription factor [Amycolatopsis sp.]